MKFFGIAIGIASLLASNATAASENEAPNVDRALDYLQAQLKDTKNGYIVLQKPNGSHTLCGWIFDWTPDRSMHEHRLFAYFLSDGSPALLLFDYGRSPAQMMGNTLVITACDRAGYLAAPMPVGSYAEALFGK